MNGAVELSILFVGLAFDGFGEVGVVAACVFRDGACSASKNGESQLVGRMKEG